jgi:PTS system mannose-specific IIB component
MITLLRLDERLIHGQIAIKWSRHTGVDRIMVANDAAAANETVKESLMMAAPASCRTVIKSVDDTLRMLENPKAADHKILIIVSSPEDLLRVLAVRKDVEKINVGNYGRIAAKKNGEVRRTYGENLYLYPEEAEQLKKAAAMGITAVYQTTPEDPAEPLEKVLDK